MSDEQQGSAGAESAVVADLVARAAAGDREAQGELFAHYAPILRAVVRVRLLRAGVQLQRETADDLDQEVALKLLGELPRHTWQGRRAFIVWMKRVADNHVRDVQKHHRAGKRDRNKETGAERAEALAGRATGAETDVDRRARLARLDALIAQLTDEQAAALRLHALGHSHAEVGEALEVSPEAARKLIARAQARLVDLERGR